MHKDYAKQVGKLGQLRKTVADLKRQLKKISDPVEIYKFYEDLILMVMEEGGDREDAKWLIAYASGLENL